ncbi:PREDICTED: uncharacterized protein LOC107336547 [Acropora digitifera]|uniref:uncharacterized protein LOC107336547 n=1 Tax=Acropora digitifera TaxID=70779 RepID=UPI00077A1F1C|nr:PREDICTED: uncharacterized protein LOC107336547 [Acropora digitifera]
MTERGTFNDPVTVLKIYASKFLRGRALDIANEEEPCDGKTIEIFVSRQSLYSDAMSELVTTPPIQDVSYPLEVTFIGENAEDYGGPRKEFFGCAMRAIRDKLFFDTGSGQFKLTQDLTALTENHYFGAGLIFGLSILQGGPLPCFMQEEQMQKLVGETTMDLSDAEKQFQLGLAKVGLLELIKCKPCLVFLLRKTAVVPLTKAKLIKLLRPRFSEEGSNQRQQENSVYRTFLEYLKEVTAGRGDTVSLQRILKFVTGSEIEPVLGYAIDPRIKFDKYAPSALPTSNTCINKLTLPIGDNLPPDRSDIFDFFDYAFTSEYFGNI